MTQQELLDFSAEMWRLFLQYLKFSIPHVMLFSVLFGIAGILIVIVLRKFRFFRREVKWWNWLTKIYYVGIPMILFLLGIAIGLIRGAEKLAHQEINKTSIEKSLTVQSFRAYLDRNKEGIRNGINSDPIGSFLATLYYQPKSDKWLERTKSRIINKITLNTAKWVITAFAAAVVAYMAGRVGDSMGISSDNIKMFYQIIKEMDLSDIDKNIDQIFRDSLHKNTAKYFKTFYIGTCSKFFLFLMIPVLDFIIYKVYLGRKRVLAAAAK